jgi:GR25 family glycosyltransferase involved in LPS biosynthesis
MFIFLHFICLLYKMNYIAIFDIGKEGFSDSSVSNSDSLFEAYFIHLERSKDRLENITRQKKRIHVPTHLFEAVDGKLLSLPDLVSSGTISSEYYNQVQNPSVYGCFLSHANLLRKLESQYQKGELSTPYSLIMEDDVQILSDTFTEKVSSILHTLESRNESFDIMLLGHSEELVGFGPHQGIPIVDSIYEYNPHSFCIGLYTYIVSHRSLSKWVSNLHPIKEAIDWQIVNLARSGNIRMLVISPVLTDPGQMKSTINE